MSRTGLSVVGRSWLPVQQQLKVGNPPSQSAIDSDWANWSILKTSPFAKGLRSAVDEGGCVIGRHDGGERWVAWFGGLHHRFLLGESAPPSGLMFRRVDAH